jgi:hypothetical protein
MQYIDFLNREADGLLSPAQRHRLLKARKLL